MTPKIERISDIPNQTLGEGPHWDDTTQSLYFVDIFGKAICKYVPSTKKFTSVSMKKQVHFIIPVRGTQDKFIISIENQFAVITWNGENDHLSDIKVIAEVKQDKGHMNDGKCDSLGRLWTGTVPSIIEELSKFIRETGVVLSLERTHLKTHATKITISNGLAWNYALGKFYYNDTYIGTVDQFDFDLQAGTITNRVPIFTLKKHGIDGPPGELSDPDGMTIDTDGNLWVACFETSKVVKIDPRRPETLLETIVFPAPQVTSVTFGGPNLDILYVTTANISKQEGDQFGAVYEVTGLNAKGFPADTFVL